VEFIVAGPVVRAENPEDLEQQVKRWAAREAREREPS
jgi:hypothetical protein